MHRIFIFAALLTASAAGAHPVGYAGSRGVMGYHSPSLSHVELSYSFKHWFATGVHHYVIPSDTEDLHASFATANFLLKRWNSDAFQANLYAVAGAGQSELSGLAEGAGLGQLQFDIEDRRYYFLAKHTRIFTDKETDLEQSMLRIGFAPYQGRFEEPHFWLILEGERQIFAENTDEESLTPFLRLFYRNILFEIGQSFDGHTKFNYITHF